MECPDGYITRLGTCFHNRVAELGVLERIFRGEYDPSLLIVYGPMRVGKSELLRYTLSRRVRGLGDIYPVLVDARAEAGRRLFENVNVSIEPVFQTTSRALSETARTLVERLSKLDLPMVSKASSLVLFIWDAIEILIRQGTISEDERIYVVIDEFHELPGYTGIRDRFRDLRILAANILDNENNPRSPWSRIRVVVTVSEGYIFARDEEGKDLDSRLTGYGARYLLVREMDPDSFSKTLEDYCSSKGYRGDRCQELGEMVISIAGRLPGWIPDIDGYIVEVTLMKEVREKIERFRTILKRVSRAEGIEPRDLAKRIYNAFRSKEYCWEHGLSYEVVEELVKSNIAYRYDEDIYFGTPSFILRPQIRLYEVAAKLIAENRSINISSKEDLKRILREHEKEDREKETRLVRA
jgi:hypothetical protein